MKPAKDKNMNTNTIKSSTVAFPFQTESLMGSDLVFFKRQHFNGELRLVFCPAGDSNVRTVDTEYMEKLGVSCSPGFHEQDNYASRVAIRANIPEELGYAAQALKKTEFRCRDGWVLQSAAIGICWTFLPDGEYQLSNGTLVEVSREGVKIRNVNSKSMTWGIL